MRVMHWAAVALAGVLLAQPALGQGGGAGGGVPQNDPNAPTESGAENLNKPTGSKASEQGTGSSSETEADGGTLHKAKSKRHKHRATEKSSRKSSQSEEKGAPESGGAQGK